MKIDDKSQCNAKQMAQTQFLSKKMPLIIKLCGPFTFDYYLSRHQQSCNRKTFCYPASASVSFTHVGGCMEFWEWHYYYGIIIISSSGNPFTVKKIADIV